MPADMLLLESKDLTTIADSVHIHGPEYLQREDGVMKLRPNFVIEAGNYSWIPCEVPVHRLGQECGEPVYVGTATKRGSGTMACLSSKFQHSGHQTVPT